MSSSRRYSGSASSSRRVSSLTNFGAFVDLGGLEGLVHVSEISHQRVDDPQKVLQLGRAGFVVMVPCIVVAVTVLYIWQKCTQISSNIIGILGHSRIGVVVAD